jgi:hypothetical protein
MTEKVAKTETAIGKHSIPDAIQQGLYQQQQQMTTITITQSNLCQHSSQGRYVGWIVVQGN